MQHTTEARRPRMTPWAGPWTSRWTSQWAALSGLLASLATLLRGDALPGAADVAFALGLLSVGLTAQLVINERLARRRERGLAEARAALEAQSAILEELARSDAVTGVANRRGLMDDLTAEVYRALRYRRPLSVLMIDIDRFKHVNDTYGHPFGDLVLREVAATLRGSVRASDLVARYGGEEFVVVLPETDLVAAGLTAEKLRTAIATHDFTDEPHGTPEAHGAPESHHADVTISVGVASLTEGRLSPAETARRLLVKADAAMYEAKHAGRNRVRSESILPRELRRAA
ncbi:MAG: GGDEF domain-containing protein [Dehalococcoidia bacterium]|nr:GGDEF domain-containing protein [Dehalococcoidia bacterium]